MQSLEVIFDEMIREGLEVKKRSLLSEELRRAFVDIFNVIIKAIAGKHFVYVFGNGGSAAESMHFSDEGVGRYALDRPAIPVIALCADSAVMSCIGNDYGFDEVFRRQVDGFVKKGDVVIGLSTSGQSKNVLNGLKRAKELEATVIGLTGGNGGKMKDVCDTVYFVPSNKVAHIQEEHLALIHMLYEALDKYLVNP